MEPLLIKIITAIVSFFVGLISAFIGIKKSLEDSLENFFNLKIKQIDDRLHLVETDVKLKISESNHNQLCDGTRQLMKVQFDDLRTNLKATDNKITHFIDNFNKHLDNVRK